MNTHVSVTDSAQPLSGIFLPYSKIASQGMKPVPDIFFTKFKNGHPGKKTGQIVITKFTYGPRREKKNGSGNF